MYPGKVDAFLEYQQERRLHEKRSNASILAKRRHLEEFIAKIKPGQHRLAGEIEK